MKKLYFLALAAMLGLTSKAQTLVQADFTGVIVPQYMGSGGTTRLPVAFRATVSNLTPNATYQYRTTMALPASIGTSENTAGNPLIVNDPNAVKYTSTLGLIGSFMTDAAGSYTGWFAVVNTGNARFTPGNELFPVLSLNSGSGSPSDTSTTAKRLALNLSIKVLGFESAAGANNGTGIWGASQAPAKHFVALYDNEAGTGRPVALTPTQSLGVTINSTVDYYATNVAGQNGAWGTIVPNTLAGGVQRISLFDVQSGVELAANTSSTGAWGSASTVNPTGGATTPIAISATAAPLITSILKPMHRPMLSVAPNPAVSWVKITGMAFDESATLFDAAGHKVQGASVNGSLLNVSGLPAGAYLVRTSKGNTARFLKAD